MKAKNSLMVILIICSVLLITWLPCQAWVCTNDDEANSIYRICNYFPLDPNNQWQYTTGEYHIVNDIHKCSSGYSGILFQTTTYENSSYLQNEAHGLLYAGCQYDEGVFEDMGTQVLLIPPQMHVGETVRTFSKENTTLDVTLVGIEQITVPVGTFTTLKIEIMAQGTCSYKTTIWLAKDIGPIKIHRTEANPSDCLGCIFVCDPNNDVVKLNTPAELISFEIVNQDPDLTGTWASLSQSFTNSKKGIKCKITGKLNIQNIGNTDASSSVVRFYFSEDNKYDSGDMYLKQISTGKIKTGKNKTKTLSYSFQYGEILTEKYIIAVIDANNTVDEADEDNNELAYGPLL
jgi:hypothetical protein